MPVTLLAMSVDSGREHQAVAETSADPKDPGQQLQLTTQLTELVELGNAALAVDSLLASLLHVAASLNGFDLLKMLLGAVVTQT